MISFTVPNGIRKVSDRFKDIFSDCGIDYHELCCLFAYFLFSSKSLSCFVRLCAWSSSVSNLSRSSSLFKPNRAMKRLRERVLKKFLPYMNPKDFCYAIDDTSNPRYGKSIFRTGKFGGSGGIYSGQKVLVIVLVDIKNKISIPLSYAFLTSKKDPQHVPGHEVAITLFKEILDSKFPKLPVTADSWFDSFSFMLNLLTIGLHYSGEIKSNRKVKGIRGRVWKSLKNYFSSFDRKRVGPKYISESKVFIRKLSSTLKIIAVYNNKTEKKAFAYYVSTDLSIVGARLWKLSRARWCIECLFRDIKQNLSFGKLPCSGERSFKPVRLFAFNPYHFIATRF